MGDRLEENTFRILIASDIHLGFAEKDPFRGNDSFVTFEEILACARDRDVDFILLGGDLFHENKPSRRALHDCMHLFRNYCFGDKPVKFEFLSDQSENFRHSSFPVVNYEDPNLNVSIPVFSIHGNHDDPTGVGQLCALDLLSDSGLVNYFGKSVNMQDIVVSPLLLQKGTTKLALYGLGSIRDERLHRLFRENKVKMLRPKEDTEEWFSIFVLHQNRARHGQTNYIPESFLDDFLDLIIWGHEHECRITPEPHGSKQFFICQPGSSVATSICPGEAVKKHIGLLEIHDKEMRLVKIELETVRQMYLENIVLRETSLNLDDIDISDKVMEYCVAKVEDLLNRAELEHSGNPKQPKHPIIRLKVEYSDSQEMFSVHRFAQIFVNKVANPNEIVTLHREKKKSIKDGQIDKATLDQILSEELATNRISAIDLVKEYFEKVGEKDQMNVLSERGMGEAIQEFVDKEEQEAIRELVKYQVEKTQNFLENRKFNVDNINEEIDKFKQERRTNTDLEEEVIRAALKASHEKRQAKGSDGFSDAEDVSEGEDDENERSSTSRGRGRGRGRGSRGSTTTRARGRGSRRGQTKQNKSPVVQKTITSAFQKQESSWKKKSQTTPAKKAELICIDSDDDDDSESFTSFSRKSTTSRASSGRRGVSYNDDDDNPF